MDDLATEMTNSVAADGQTSMTGPLKASSGTVSLPSHTFASDPDTGAYRSASNEYSLAAGGTRIVAVTSAGLDVKTGTVLLAGVAAFPVPTAQIGDAAVTLQKLYQPSAVSLLLGSNSNAALTITGAASNGGPNLIRLTVASTATFSTGQKKIVNGVTGTTEANARWTITVVDATHIDLQGSTFTNAYVSGGTIGGGVDEIVVGSGLSMSGATLSANLNTTSFYGYLSGLELSTAGSSATFGVSVGSANDADQTDMMVLASAYTKTTSAWTVGTAAGALDTGTIANNTWYHVYIIKRPDTGVVDILISTSASSPTMPGSGAYTLKRRIGSIRTNGSAQWVKFFQDGDEFIWDAPFADQVNVTSLGASALYTLTVPTGPSVIAHFISYYNSSAIASYILLSSGVSAAQTVNSPTANREQEITVAGKPVISRQSILTNGSAQIRATGNGVGSTDWYVNTTGWRDRRGK
ncbi:MAG: hypothetical protein WC058_15110 [Phycisphaeraceae bacterium]